MGQKFDFAEFTRHCSRYCLPATPSVHLKLEALHRYCETLLEEYHPDRAARLDCRAGCGTCCIVNVSVLLPEAFAICAYLEQQDQTGAHFDREIDQLWTRVRGVEDEERVCMRQPCLFLDTSGSCSIYPVRPLLCRGVTSTDAKSCRQSFNAFLFNEQLSVEMNLFQHELYRSAYLGLSRGQENSGLDGRGFELTGILRYLLRNTHNHDALKSGLRLDWNDLA